MVKFLYTYLYLILFSSSFLFSQSTPQVIVENMGRGINLGNVLSATTEGNWAFPIYETFFDDLVNQGFTNVRIPIDFFEGSFLSANYSVNGSKRTLTNLINCENNSCFSRQAGSEGD
jgi:aryl-phospho-beta-D-glucosidase BglC (GH1 family)